MAVGFRPRCRIGLVGVGAGTSAVVPRGLAGASPTAPTGASSGVFVIGDGHAAVGDTVEFWGAPEAKDTIVSGGGAPDLFNGFADSFILDPTRCTGTFSTAPGNSSDPPPPLADEIPVLITDSVTKSGPVISGTVVGEAWVTVAPDPGHPDTGVVTGLARTPANSGGSSGSNCG
jgi:hypothetical protein